MARQPEFGGGDDAALLALADRLGGIVEPLARLDLDEDEDAAPPRHDVDLADGGFEPAEQDAVALGDEKGRGAALRRQAEAERNAAFRIGRRPRLTPGNALTFRHRLCSR
jgi:hypothetical protein